MGDVAWDARVRALRTAADDCRVATVLGLPPMPLRALQCFSSLLRATYPVNTETPATSATTAAMPTRLGVEPRPSKSAIWVTVSSCVRMLARPPSGLTGMSVPRPLSRRSRSFLPSCETALPRMDGRLQQRVTFGGAVCSLTCGLIALGAKHTLFFVRLPTQPLRARRAPTPAEEALNAADAAAGVHVAPPGGTGQTVLEIPLPRTMLPDGRRRACVPVALLEVGRDLLLVVASDGRMFAATLVDSATAAAFQPHPNATRFVARGAPFVVDLAPLAPLPPPTVSGSTSGTEEWQSVPRSPASEGTVTPVHAARWWGAAVLLRRGELWLVDGSATLTALALNDVLRPFATASTEGSATPPLPRPYPVQRWRSTPATMRLTRIAGAHATLALYDEATRTTFVATVGTAHSTATSAASSGSRPSGTLTHVTTSTGTTTTTPSRVLCSPGFNNAGDTTSPPTARSSDGPSSGSSDAPSAASSVVPVLPPAAPEVVLRIVAQGVAAAAVPSGVPITGPGTDSDISSVAETPSARCTTPRLSSAAVPSLVESPPQWTTGLVHGLAVADAPALRVAVADGLASGVAFCDLPVDAHTARVAALTVESAAEQHTHPGLVPLPGHSVTAAAFVPPAVAHREHPLLPLLPGFPPPPLRPGDCVVATQGFRSTSPIRVVSLLVADQ